MINSKNYFKFLKKNILNVFYIVKKKDTLYSISKNFHYSFDQLIRYNNLKKPNRILIGQKLLLNRILIHDIFNQNKSIITFCIFCNKKIGLQHKICEKKWSWPLKNKYMSFFYNSSSNQQGIEINGFEGQSVFSISKGRVVYVGDFFKNYGKLIIIKHNSDYLSMYGFNKYIFVKINQKVNQDQKISTIGYSKNNLSKLYFEVRFKGSPINIFNFFPNIQLKKNINL
ncbi:Murein hydrolase activator NlpD [Buchnera aphidicola (Protaphis terricola)]